MDEPQSEPQSRLIGRRAHFSAEEEDAIWDITLKTLREKATDMHSLPPALNPLSGSFWKERKGMHPSIMQRNISTLSKKFRRMWTRKQINRLAPEDLTFLQKKLGAFEDQLVEADGNQNFVPLSMVATEHEKLPPIPAEWVEPSQDDDAVSSSPQPEGSIASTSSYPQPDSSATSTSSSLQPESSFAADSNLEFTMMLNRRLEAQDPELMRTWTEVCEKMSHAVAEVMKERGLSEAFAKVLSTSADAMRGASATEGGAGVGAAKPNARKRRARKVPEKILAEKKSPAESDAPVCRKVGINESNPTSSSSSTHLNDCNF
uniref:Myb_DNA-bind_5 domain-containing protein n=1 Tax=Steinernema glaseri TaxID=37863 RepID=A0A1I7YNN9_9BILA